MKKINVILACVALVAIAVSCCQADPYGYRVKGNQIVYNTPERPADQKSMLGYAEEPI